MDQNKQKVVTRFAPSPTGFLHIGGVRTALYAYLFARKHEGTFILRIEDTDKNREVDGSILHIQESLRWVGIEWDYGPDKAGPHGSYLQSDRLDIYHRYAKKLIEKGHAYPDPYTTEELEAFRTQAASENRPFLFRDHRPSTIEAWDGKKPLRFKVPEIKRHTWTDVTRGTLSAGEEALDDFILIKGDGYPTYNFAHIVDDFEMGVTHIMRADEFVSSTPKFLSLYDALEISYPTFVTLPPIMRADGKKKLGKRDGAKDILEYRTDGYLPQAMMNFLALIGWNPGGDRELFFTEKELIEAFTLEKIQRSGGAFNEEKLMWMNKQFINQLSADAQYEYVLDSIVNRVKELSQYNEERVRRAVSTFLERAQYKKEIRDASEAGEYDYLFSTPSYDVSILKWKNDETVSAAKPRLLKAIELLESTDFSTPDTVKSSLWSYAEEIGKGELLWPIRIALSGKERSPDPFTLAYILGKEETITRIKTACDKIVV